ncbi:DUF927 domain-containing protein [Tepidimonas taiwanensis]|uniref:DNA primase TraC n=1 Tax=Tepidimonas taiwanensis TaxID=307486 RepID=A0A554XE81_9BURK|nr:DUF927 domain-containing protein [Tepidimonas taiwanensis]TSE34147.1 DNA primase TraC [Tepidimonas taiwanensis]UBQ04882.1 DUF927 domain-containing protein [Tepidimonas taiwanensis]
MLIDASCTGALSSLPAPRLYPVEAFRNAIAAAGLTPPDDIIPDGKLRRFASDGKRGDDAGWYVLHLDGVPAGAFGCWRSGIKRRWCSKTREAMTPAEREAYRRKLQAMRQQRDADTAQRQQQAAQVAARRWQAAAPATAEHPYLSAKGVKPYGVKVEADGYLIVPMRDAGGKLWNIERINPRNSEDKKGLLGGRRTGCYHAIGKPEGVLIVCEGYATGASIHEATGCAVAVAFNAGNLEPVALALRSKYPDARLIVAADDDWRKEGNPGLTKASAAARAAGALLAVPRFPADRPDKAKDFNDLHQLAGLQAVAACFEAAQPRADIAFDRQDGVTGVTEVTPLIHNEFSVTPQPEAGVTGVTDGADPVPGEEGRPAFKVFDDWVQRPGGQRLRPGVWHFGIKPGKGEAPPVLTDTWVCSPLHVVAVASDDHDANYGRLLRLRNTHGRWREWSMPMAMLAGRGDELRGVLLSLGVEIDPHARHLLDVYLQSQHPRRSVTCVQQVGWHRGCFVLPDAVIGPGAQDVVFQSEEALLADYATAGNLQSWRDAIAARAVGNPLLMLALCAAFAGPLLHRCNAEGGGLHFVGDSSTGKTTLLEAARSVWGGPAFKRSWRATANGIEGAAVLFNDGLLALDEISECEPRDIGLIVYALTNGTGKARASRTGAARSLRRWRCFVLSNGERTIATSMQEVGIKAKAGQSVRLLDVPVARQHGAFDELHGFEDARALADAIKEAANRHYGHAGRAFLDRLTHDTENHAELLDTIRSLPEFAAQGAHGQQHRAANRFALLALAGELATEYGLTGWPEGAAVKAAALGFELWGAQRGNGSDEQRRILEQVAAFIDRHADARFSATDAPESHLVRDRAGWWTTGSSGERIFLFTADGFAEAVRGYDKQRAYDALVQAGAADAPGEDGKRQRCMRIAGRTVKVYRIYAERLGEQV